MRVDGSVTNVDFYVEAQAGCDIYIKTIAIVIADAGATLNKFGNITALANGVEFFWETQADGETTLHPGLTSNFDFVQLCGGQPAFGDSAGAFRGTNIQGSSEGYIPVLDVGKIFGMPYGLRLKEGTTERLVFRVRDDTTGVDRFDIVAFGSTLSE